MSAYRARITRENTWCWRVVVNGVSVNGASHWEWHCMTRRGARRSAQRHMERLTKWDLRAEEIRGGAR